MSDATAVGNGQRVQKTVDGVVSRFLWAGSEIIKEYTATGGLKAQYFLGGGRTAIKHNGKWNFYLSDGLGSTVMLTDHRGRPVATWDYSDDGETTQLSGSASVYNPFLYTGQELDKETGYYHLRARHYATSLGKFLARDPIGYAGGSNMYAYCAGDPVNFIDPSGLVFSSETNVVVVPHIGVTGIFLETSTAGDSNANVVVSTTARVGDGRGNYREIPIYLGKDYAQKGPERRAPKAQKELNLGTLCPNSIVDTVLVVDNKDLEGALTIEISVHSIIAQDGKVGISNFLRKEFAVKNVELGPPPQPLRSPTNEGRPGRYTDGR